MSISRRSFLKMAGLSTVAVAGTALFTGCSSLITFTTVHLEYADEVYDAFVADVTDPVEKSKKRQQFQDAIDQSNKFLSGAYLPGFKEVSKDFIFGYISMPFEKLMGTYEVDKWMDRLDIVTDANGKIQVENDVIPIKVVLKK